MRRGKRLRRWMTITVVSLALVVVILVNSVCSCLPDVYVAVDLAAVPAHVLENARDRSPGLIFQRAWKFAPGGRFDQGVLGYLLRSQVHWYESRDIEVRLGSGPEYLEPIK